jgi:hypothetical protein
VYTLVNTEGGWGGVTDSFEFAAQPMVGDGTIVARVTSVQLGSAGAASWGLMLRSGPGSGAPFVFFDLTGSSASLESWWRSTAGTTATQVAGPTNIGSTPYWLKLVRSGSTVTGYYSFNGVDWTVAATQSIDLGSAVYAGLAVVENTPGYGYTATIQFDNVVVGTSSDFYLSPLASSPAMGDVSSYELGISPLNGFSAIVSLSVAGLPSGVTAVLNPSTVTGPGLVELTITAPPGTAAGSYPFVMSATGGNQTHTVTGALTVLSGRPTGSALDSSNPLSANLVGLFLMNEAAGTTDMNIVDGQTASFSGTTSPVWNANDPSVVFQGGGALSSFLDAGTDLAFDQLPTSTVTVVARLLVNTLAPAGICEKNDGNALAGFIFGWDSSNALHLNVEKSGSDMRVSTAGGAVPVGQSVQVAFTWDGTVGTAAAAHLFVNGTELTKASSSDGGGTLSYANATNRPFRIGTASWDPMSGSIDGKMAYLAVYRGRILTPTEMTQLDFQLPIRTN